MRHHRFPTNGARRWEGFWPDQLGEVPPNLNLESLTRRERVNRHAFDQGAERLHKFAARRTVRPRVRVRVLGEARRELVNLSQVVAYEARM